MSLTRIDRIAVFTLSVGIATYAWHMVISHRARWHGEDAEARRNHFQSNTVLLTAGPDHVNTYVWKKTDFGHWLQKTYSFNVSGESVFDRAKRLINAVDREDPGLRAFVLEPDVPTAATTGSNIVGTMTFSRALDLLTAGTACRWEIADLSLLSIFCNEPPILQPQTEARYRAGLPGHANAVACLEKFWADADAGPEADFDIPAGDATVTLQEWLAVVYNNVCNDDAPNFLWSEDMLPGHSTQPIRGRYTVGLAIRIMLEGSGLRVERQKETWVLTTVKESDPTDS